MGIRVDCLAVIVDSGINADAVRINEGLKVYWVIIHWLKIGELILFFLFFSFAKAGRPTHYREGLIWFLLCAQKAIDGVYLLPSHQTRFLDMIWIYF